MSNSQHKNQKITFFADGPVRKEALEPVINEASRRGYTTNVTDDLSAEAEIGIYNEHTYRIKEVNSEFSCIMFHSIDCSYKKRHWMREHWDSFDIGFVIGEVAASNWQSQSSFPKARPEIGVFPAGWPKGDKFSSNEFKEKIRNEKREHDISSEITIIYAPSGNVSDKKKMEELFNAVGEIEFQVDLLIRQHPSVENQIPKELVEYVKENDRIHVLNQSRDIIECIALADILISDESSVLLESVLTNTIPISVVDWPIVSHRGRQKETESAKTIPDTAIRTTRTSLSDTLEKVIRNYDFYHGQMAENRERHFSNIGNSAKVTMDVIDAYVNGESPPIEPLESNESLSANIYWGARELPTNIYYDVRHQIINSLGDSSKEKLKKLKVDRALSKVDNIFDYR